MVIRMRMILSETRTTSNTFSHHSSARRTPTPPVPLSFPDQKSLKRESFPTICLTPSIFHLVSWRQHRSTLLLDTVSTTSLAFCFIVPTWSVPTRKDFGHLLDSPLGPDPAAPHHRAAKPEMLLITLFNLSCSWNFGRTYLINIKACPCKHLEVFISNQKVLQY